jgi:hypothetical protein
LRHSGVLCLCLAACGINPVELSAARVGTEIVLGTVPRSAIDRLAADRGQTAAAPMQLSFVYPSDALAIPDGLAPIAFEWQGMPGPAKPAPNDKTMPPMPGPMAGTGGMPNPQDMPGMKSAGADAPKPMPPGAAAARGTLTAYELRASGAHGELRLYTAASPASFPAERWRAFVHDQLAGPLRVELRGLAQNGEIVRAAPLTLSVRPALPAGSLYAWSTSARGIVRASLDATRAQALAPPADAAGSGGAPCIGCHSVSRDGRRVLAAIGGSPRLLSWQPGSSSSVSIEGAALAPNNYVFGSFDPFATRIALAYAGGLRLYDADSGQLLAEAKWPGIAVDHPDWSPDGRYIAVSVTTAAPGDTRDIARIRVGPDGTLESPQSLVTGMPKDASRDYPAYSPDAEWIAFEQRKGPAPSNQSTLWLVAADGGEAIQLQRAAALAKPEVASDWAPNWLPTDVPGQAWLVFASERAVGGFVPAPGQRQLFLSALDLPLATAGKDPSLPALWLPFQERSSSYRRAQWARAVNVCSSAPELCNAPDDGCAGRDPSPDLCGDGIDNDCDGQSDEGCGCGFRELCGNGVDDDCDGVVDEALCAPADARAKP